jgi:2-polyprenyl-6-methoxyphenol hydroxylase-like FAD-dependent oxidoreductase
MAASKKQKLDVLIVGGGPTGIPQSDFESCLRDRLGELGGEVEFGRRCTELSRLGRGARHTS